MSRTTADAVKLVLMDDHGNRRDGSTPDLTPFIDTASAFVDDAIECATEKGLTIDSTRAELLERWLAAHLYAISDKPYSSKNTEGASASFNGQTAMYFEATLYGQQVMRLDKSGCLAAVGGAEAKVAGGLWLGKTPSEQIPYWERD